MARKRAWNGMEYYNKVDPDENIAGEGDGPITGDDGNIWND